MLTSLMKRFLLLSSLLLASALTTFASDADAHFVRRVWPLFAEKCLSCHGDDEAKIKGGLDLRTRANLMLGGDSDKPAIIPGKPDESPLILAVLRQSEDFEAMPPKEPDRLSAQQIDWLKEWITAGAPWPDAAKQKQIAATNHEQWSAEDGIVMKTSGGLSADWTNRRYKSEGMWAYQPVTKPAVPGAPPAQEREKERKRDREKKTAAVSPSPPLPFSILFPIGKRVFSPLARIMFCPSLFQHILQSWHAANC